jgi:hypothetical protein
MVRLSGDTFHNFKAEFRKMSKAERIGLLAQMQLRIAAIYAVENEDLQRIERQARQEKQHQAIEDSRRKSKTQHLQSLPQQVTSPSHQDQRQTQLSSGLHQHMGSTAQNQEVQRRHQLSTLMRHQILEQEQQSISIDRINSNERQMATQRQQQQLAQLVGQHLHDPQQQQQQQPLDNSQQHGSQTPVPLPQFGLQLAQTPGSATIFRHYIGGATSSPPVGRGKEGTPSTATASNSKRPRGRPRKHPLPYTS